MPHIPRGEGKNNDENAHYDFDNHVKNLQYKRRPILLGRPLSSKKSESTEHSIMTLVEPAMFNI